MTLLAGFVIAALGWWLLKQFARGNPAHMARVLKQVGGGASLVAAVALGVKGRFDMALLLGGTGAWLLGWNHPMLPRMFRSAAPPTPGRMSRVRSAALEMELDHDSGGLDGTVLAGAFLGRRLADLDLGSLQRLEADLARMDPEGLRLLEAYLDGRFPGWRKDADRNTDPGPRTEPKSGAMSEQEAYQILGLQPGAGLDDVRRAHRTLMKKLHPDQGGSTYLASRVNQAKDVLTDRHR